MTNIEKQKYEDLLVLIEGSLKEFLSNTRKLYLKEPKFISIVMEWYSFLHHNITFSMFVGTLPKDFIDVYNVNCKGTLMSGYRSRVSINVSKEAKEFIIQKQSEMEKTIKKVLIDN